MKVRVELWSPAGLAKKLRETALACAVLSFWLIAAIAIIGPPHLAGAAPREPAGQDLLFVYYANETPEQALKQSPNLTTLLALLHQSRAPLAGKLATIIETDIGDFRAQADRDQVALLEAARRIGFDLAIFTNTLAQDGTYRFYRHAKDAPELRPLPPLPPAANEILSLSPLSRPEVFEAALAAVAAQYDSGSLQIVLVTFSHGNLDMALMPRVNTDLSTTEAIEDFKRSLERGGGGDAPDWATLQGTDKIAFWNVLTRVSSKTGVSFPLVFRQACGSGPNGWRELMEIPDSVSTIGHSARRNIAVDLIDYAQIFRTGQRQSNWIELLTTGLKQRDIEVSTRQTIWIWAFLSSLLNVHPAFYFIPLLAWLAFYGPRLARIILRRRQTRGKAKPGATS